MALTSDNDSETTVVAEVTIRIPCGASGDLVGDAEERFMRPAGVTAATVNELHGIEPRLSATVITVTITIQVTPAVNDNEELRKHLTAVPGLESITRLVV